jgi:nitrogen regulatory protein PII
MMKAIFITYGQALTQPVEELLTKMGIRGFTRWDETQGRGSNNGEPHYGTHAWTSKNGSILTIVDDSMASPLLDAFRRLNEHAEEQGLSVFVWNVEEKL